MINPQPKMNFAIVRDGRYWWRRSSCRSCDQSSKAKTRSCEVCGKLSRGYSTLEVDHVKVGQVRGLLCESCVEKVKAGRTKSVRSYLRNFEPTPLSKSVHGNLQRIRICRVW
jgi:hypothetical protein